MIRSSTGALIKTGANSPIRLTGLQNGVPYTVSVSAVNGNGEGSGDSVSVTPAELFAYGVADIPSTTSMILNWSTTNESSTQIQYSITT